MYRLSDSRYEEIKKIVVDMFIRYDISSTPISAFEIAIKMGINLVPYSSYSESAQELLTKESQDGFVFINNGKATIYYNQEMKYERVQNTIMHEIGHIVLGHTEDSELAEAEVKFFAKYALAPPVLMEKYNVTNIVDVLSHFDISMEAACYALKYYQKWRKQHTDTYTDYELRLLTQFS